VIGIGCPCDAQGEVFHPSGIASESNGKNGSNPETAPQAIQNLSASAHGYANSGRSDFAQPTAKAARATPAPASDDDAPSHKRYPRTPEEFAEDAREMEKLAQEARAAGDAERAREIARDARAAWKKAGIKDAS
jgi:hypothetical protein